MPRTAVGNFLALFTFALVATALGSAQSKTQLDLAVTLGRNSSWQAAQASGASIYKLVVVTVDNPDRRHSCRVRSFTTDKLVCSRFFGGPRIYGPEQVAAIIIPGEGHARIRILLGLNAAAGAVIWAPLCLRLHVRHARGLLRLWPYCSSVLPAPLPTQIMFRISSCTWRPVNN
jgi:hypothetical protein